MITLTEEQLQVQDNVLTWLHEGDTWYTAVTGNAGTGKTTLMGSLVNALARKVKTIRLVTFTGKAASVLRGKLEAFDAMHRNVEVSTLHSFLYKFMGRHENGKLKFYLNSEVSADLVIVDEASMITERMANDLKACGMRVIFVGDPGQLPPVEGSCFKGLFDFPENQLKTIHRQAEDNPIIQLAYLARDGKRIPFGVQRQGIGKFRNSAQTQQIVRKFVDTMDGVDNGILLCAKNKTRAALNSLVRTAKGFGTGGFPIPGERVICLRNNKASGVMNGQFGEVRSVVNHLHPDTGVMLLEMKITVEGRDVETLCVADTFGSSSVEALSACQESAILQDFFFPQVDQWDFGYAVSVHKSQGSEWDRVVLFDERMANMGDDTYNKWLYTGITRAKQKLCIVSQ